MCLITSVCWCFVPIFLAVWSSNWRLCSAFESVDIEYCNDTNANVSTINRGTIYCSILARIFIWYTCKNCTSVSHCSCTRGGITNRPSQSTLLINWVARTLVVQWPQRCDKITHILGCSTATNTVRRFTIAKREASLKPSEEDIWLDSVSCSQKEFSNINIVTLQDTSWVGSSQWGVTQFGRGWTKTSTGEAFKRKHKRQWICAGLQYVLTLSCWLTAPMLVQQWWPLTYTAHGGLPETVWTRSITKAFL